MWVKVCGVVREIDVLSCVDAGVSSVGFLIRTSKQFDKYPEMLSISRAKTLIEFSKEKILSTLLIHERDLVTIVNILNKLQPDIIQIQPRSNLSVNDIDYVKNLFPKIKVIKTIGMNPKSTTSDNQDIYTLINQIQTYEKTGLIDYINIDTIANGGGGVGLTHNWKHSKKIIESVQLNCILAGGLTPLNARKAINITSPFGLDVMSGVGYEGISKDIKDSQRIYALMKSIK